MTTLSATKIGNYLEIGDAARWHFVNGPWADGDEHALTLPAQTKEIVGDAMEGLHFAFDTTSAYRDVRVRFEFRLQPHSDAGVVLRAQDESHFYLLHFPNCGQACRAQHFWVAFSKMDEQGYLKLIKLEMVRRVPSQSGVWLRADMTLSGNMLTARISDHGYFEAQDDTYSRAGATGLYLFREASIRRVSVEGTRQGSAWKRGATQPANWFHPCPDMKYGLWQRPINLLRLSGGELLLLYAVQERPYEGHVTYVLSRSRDGGKTWGEPEPLPEWKAEDHWVQPLLHLTPRGRLICLMQRKDKLEACESSDQGRTWSEPSPVTSTPPPAGVKNYNYVGGRQGVLNLADGSMVLFGLGGHETSASQFPVWTWSSIHCQAYSCRSSDDGKTWSPLANMDTPGFDKDGKPFEGSLDLTEVCATQMSNGQIMGLIRPCYSPWMWETWSEDGGKSWGPCVRGPFPGYASSNMLRLASGAVLVAHRLPCLTIHLSRDEGHTWDQGTMIDSGLWAMGSMIEVEPDVVLYVYWDTAMSFMRGQFIKVTPDALVPARTF